MKRRVRTTLIVLATLVVLLGVAPLLVPIPPLKGTLPIEQLADADSRFLEWQGLRVHYKQAGQGEPAIVLLHGFGASLYSWNEVLEPLSALGAVIAYDRPAFGLTSRPMPGDWQGGNPYSAEARELYRKPLQMANWDRALWEFTLASEILLLAEQLDQLTLPVLVISGDQDRIVPFESSQRLADALGVTPVVIADAGHLPHEEQPARFLQAVSPFVAALP